MSDIYTYKPDPQPNIRPEDQAKIDHLMSADPLKGFGFPGRDTGIIDDPFEILRMRAKDEEITAQIREKLKYSDADNPSFSRPLAEKLFEAPKYKDITALVEIDLSTDKPEVVHLRDDIIARKVNEGQSVKDSEYTGFMEAGNLALHPEYKAVFKKAKDLLENDPSLSVVKVEVQLEGREKMSIGIMRPMVHEPVAELRARIGNNEVIDLDTSSGKPLPIVKEADGTTRVIKAEEIEQWNNAYPGEFKLFQKSQTQRVSKVTEVPVADLSSEGGKLAQDFFKAKIVPNCTAIIELDVVDGRSKGVHINPAILSSKVTPGADPRLDADTGFDGAAKVVLGTAGEDYLSQARETFLANPGKSTVTIPGDALGQPGKDVVIMRSPAPQVIRELRHNLRYDGTGGIISGFQLDPNSPTPIPMVEREKGKFTPLTKSELEAWERWYPGEIERFKKEHAKKHQTIKEGERQVAELVTPRDEAKVAQNMLTEMGAIKYVICVDPATGEPSSFHTKGRELSNAEMDIVKRNWNPNFGQIEAQKFASNPNLAADITYVGHDIVAVVNNKKLADIYTEGDINQILKDKHPAPLGADGKPLTATTTTFLHYTQKLQFKS